VEGGLWKSNRLKIARHMGEGVQKSPMRDGTTKHRVRPDYARLSRTR
jgi:hypothetical protein